MPPQRTERKTKAPAKPRKSSDKESNGEDASITPKDGIVNLEFMTTGRPLFDLHREYDEDTMDKMSKKQISKLTKDFNDLNEKHFKKNHNEVPDWPWVVSKQGWKKFQRWDMDLQKRDQGNFGMYFYNDFSGYGCQEVVENWMLSFEKEFNKSDNTAGRLWMHIEALCYLFCEGFAGEMYMHDDGECQADTLLLIGTAVLATLNQLEQEEAWDLIPNRSNILSTLFMWISDHMDAMSMCEEASLQHWPALVRVYAEKHDMPIEGVYDIKNQLAHFPTSELEDALVKKAKRPSSKDKWSFKTALKNFKKTHRKGKNIGGNIYDITKMTKAERKKASLDNTDPLEEMGMPPEISDSE